MNYYSKRGFFNPKLLFGEYLYNNNKNINCNYNKQNLAIKCGVHFTIISLPILEP